MAARRLYNPAEELAAYCAAARSGMARGSRLLHDDVAPLLSAAGLKLALVRDEHPAADADLAEVVGLLDQAMDRVRQVSLDLSPSPAARTGLRPAIEELIEAFPNVTLAYSATAKLPPYAASILYEIAARAVRAAVDAQASRIRVSVTGASGVRIRVADNGRSTGRALALSATALLARAYGATLDLTTKKDTIVLIRHGVRRTTGR